MKKAKEHEQSEHHLLKHILRMEKHIMASLADVNAALVQLASDVAALKAQPPSAATAADLDAVVAQVQAIDAAVKPAV